MHGQNSLPPKLPSDSPSMEALNWGVYLHPAVFRRHTHAFNVLRSLRLNGVLQYVHTMVKNIREERAVEAVATAPETGDNELVADSSSSLLTTESSASGGVRRGGCEKASEVVATSLADGEINERAVRYLFSQSIRTTQPQLVSYDITVSPARVRRPQHRNGSLDEGDWVRDEMHKSDRNVFETVLLTGPQMAASDARILEMEGFGEKAQKELRWWGEHCNAQEYFSVLQDHLYGCRSVARVPLDSFEAYDPTESRTSGSGAADELPPSPTHQRSWSDIHMKSSSAYSTTVTEQIMGGMEGSGMHHSPFLSGLEVAIGTMMVGETAEFFIAADASFGYTGPPVASGHSSSTASDRSGPYASLAAEQMASPSSLHDLENPRFCPPVLFHHLQQLVRHGHHGVLHFSVRLRERLPLVRPISSSQMLSQFVLQSSRLSPSSFANVLSSRQEDRAGNANDPEERMKVYNSTNPFLFWVHSNICQTTPRCTFNRWVSAAPSPQYGRRPSWLIPASERRAVAVSSKVLERLRHRILRGEGAPSAATDPDGLTHSDVDGSLQIALLTAVLYEMGSLTAYEGRGVEISGLEWGLPMVYGYHTYSLNGAVRQALNVTLKEMGRNRKAAPASEDVKVNRRQEWHKSNAKAVHRMLQAYACHPHLDGPPVTYSLAGINPLNRALLEFPQLTVHIPNGHYTRREEHERKPDDRYASGCSVPSSASLGSLADDSPPQQTLPHVASMEGSLPLLASTRTPAHGGASPLSLTLGAGKASPPPFGSFASLGEADAVPSSAVAHGAAVLPCWVDAVLQACPFETVSKVFVNSRHRFDDEGFFSVLLHELRSDAIDMLNHVEITAAGMERVHWSRQSLERATYEEGVDRTVSAFFDTMSHQSAVRALFAVVYRPPPSRCSASFGALSKEGEDGGDDADGGGLQTTAPNYPRHIFHIKSPDRRSGFRVLQDTLSEPELYRRFRARELGSSRSCQRAEEQGYRLTVEMGKIPDDVALPPREKENGAPHKGREEVKADADRRNGNSGVGHFTMMEKQLCFSPYAEMFFWVNPRKSLSFVEQKLQDACALLYYYRVHAEGIRHPSVNANRFIPSGNHLQPLATEANDTRFECCTDQLAAGLRRLRGLLLGIPPVSPNPEPQSTRTGVPSDIALPPLQEVIEQSVFYPIPFALSAPQRQHFILRRIVCKAIQKAFQCIFLLTCNVNEQLVTPDDPEAASRLRGLCGLLRAAGASWAEAEPLRCSAKHGGLPPSLMDTMLSAPAGVDAAMASLTQDTVSPAECAARYGLLGASLATAALGMEELQDGYLSMHGYDFATAALLYLPHHPSLWWLRARLDVRLGRVHWAQEDLEVAVGLEELGPLEDYFNDPPSPTTRSEDTRTGTRLKELQEQLQLVSAWLEEAPQDPLFGA